MGRSVIPHPRAEVVAYTTHEPDEEFYRSIFEEDMNAGDIDEDEDFDRWMYSQWEEDSQHSWDDLKEWVRETLENTWPSFESADERSTGYGWRDENIVLMQNAHSEVSISEYCGVVAISLAPRSDFDYYYSEEVSVANLGARWRQSISEKFNKIFGTMHRLGGFSDGTSVYQKVS